MPSLFRVYDGIHWKSRGIHRWIISIHVHKINKENKLHNYMPQKDQHTMYNDKKKNLGKNSIKLLQTLMKIYKTLLKDTNNN